MSKRVKKQKLGSSPIGVQIRVKTCQNVSKQYFLTLFFDTCAAVREVCKFVSKRVKKHCVSKNVCTRPRVKRQTHRFRLMFRVKTYQNVVKTYFCPSGSLEMCTKALQILPNQLQKCQSVSKRFKKRRKCKKTPCFSRVSKRVEMCQNVSKSSRVSKRVKKVSKTCQNGSIRFKTCQKILKSVISCNVSCQNVSKLVFDTCLQLFCFHFCILGLFLVSC